MYMYVHTSTQTKQFNSYFPNKPREPELTGCLLTSRPHSLLEVNPTVSIGWLRGTVIERRSLAGELSLSCARPVADG